MPQIFPGALGDFLGVAPGSATWTPDTEAGLLVWQDAADADTIVAVGSALTTWGNKGSLGGVMNATNVEVVANDLNGLDVIATDEAASSILQHASAVIDVPNLTIIAAVADVDANTSGRVHTVIDMQEQSGSFNGGKVQTYNDFASMAGQRQVYAEGNGATPVLYKNNQTDVLDLNLNEWAIVTVTLTGLDALSGAGIPFTMGVNASLSLFSSMKFAEIMVYEGIKPAFTLDSAFAYLSTKWGIPGYLSLQNGDTLLLEDGTPLELE